MPVEIMAKRGIDTLRFGPLKPVGFDDPRYAIKGHMPLCNCVKIILREISIIWLVFKQI